MTLSFWPSSPYLLSVWATDRRHCTRLPILWTSGWGDFLVKAQHLWETPGSSEFARKPKTCECKWVGGGVGAGMKWLGDPARSPSFIKMTLGSLTPPRGQPKLLELLCIWPERAVSRWSYYTGRAEQQDLFCSLINQFRTVTTWHLVSLWNLTNYSRKLTGECFLPPHPQFNYGPGITDHNNDESWVKFYCMIFRGRNPFAGRI